MSKRFLPIVIGTASHVMPSVAGGWLARQFLTPARRQQEDPANATARALGDGGVVWSTAGGPKQAILIHGWSGYRAQFSQIAQLLTERGFTLHFIDPPGHGAAGHGPSNPARFVRAIEQTIALTGEPELAIGHSMGGAALLHLAAGDRPTLADRIVSISAPHGVRYPMNAAAKMLRLSKSARDHFIAKVEREVGARRAAFDVLPRASQSRVSLTVVHDPKDPQIPFDHAENIARCWPDAELIATSGAGHNRTLQAGATLAAIQSILTELAA